MAERVGGQKISRQRNDLTRVSESQWQNRIVGHGVEDPGDLLANPKNWRTHPQAQQDALGGVLGEIGWIQSVIVNQRTGHVIDGHLRVSLAIEQGETQIPVVYVDLSNDEEALALATLDPLGAMAETDSEQLRELLEGISTEDDAIRAMLDGLIETPKPELSPPDGFREFGDDIETEYKCPSCEYEWSGRPKSDA